MLSTASSPYVKISNVSHPAPPQTPKTSGIQEETSSTVLATTGGQQTAASTLAVPLTTPAGQQTAASTSVVPLTTPAGQQTAASTPAALATPARCKPTPEEILRHKRLQGALRVLLTLPHGDFTTIRINGVECNFVNDESFHNGVSPMKSTRHFMVQGRKVEKLYWFEQFAAITTPRYMYVEFCAFTNGDICLGVWETRCNKPFHALLIYRVDRQRVELITAHHYRALFPDNLFDPAKLFDMEFAVK